MKQYNDSYGNSMEIIMHSSIKTVSFIGISTIEIDVQLQLSNGLPTFTIVGLPDKTVAESKERIRACLYSLGVNFPAQRVTVNLAPADVQKEGSHYDLPIAIALLSALSIIKCEEINNIVAIGELSLNGTIAKVTGCLPAAIYAKSINKILVCPSVCAQEAYWGGDDRIIAANDLLSLINHFNGTHTLPPLKHIVKNTSVISSEINHSITSTTKTNCFSDIKGQIVAKRALEIAASGGHNVLMFGPPGVGKSMLASRAPSILPPLTPEEALETTMIHSLAGQIGEKGLITERPYRAPHHSASLPALVGGGVKAQPGEISLSHRGILFLDELAEFSRAALESLRQPLEVGSITISRVNNHVTYPAQIQLIAAMNPCKCGYLGNAKKECSRAPKCGKEYLQKISGPVLDRIDIFLDIPDINIKDFMQDKSLVETSEVIRKRVIAARKIQLERFKNSNIKTNSEVDGHELEKYLTDEARQLLYLCVEKTQISARGYYRVIKLARTLADMEAIETINKYHISETLGYRKITF